MLRNTRCSILIPECLSDRDCSGLPTSKTGAAVRKQAPVLVQNLIAAIKGEPLEAKYDGYTSMPTSDRLW